MSISEALPPLLIKLKFLRLITRKGGGEEEELELGRGGSCHCCGVKMGEKS
jgi:hypothetical protein